LEDDCVENENENVSFPLGGSYHAQLDDLLDGPHIINVRNS